MITRAPGSMRPSEAGRRVIAISIALSLFLAIALSLVACGPSGSQPTQPGPQMTLRVGDQFDFLRTVVAAAGQDTRPGYKLEWANFVGGPAMIAAETGGSIDIGWMAETPTIFAQAAGSPIKVAAMARRSGPGVMALVVAANSPIHSVHDLKGKRVLYLAGTLAQYFVLRLLEQEGLSLSDIEPVSATPGSESALLADGRIDATVMADPKLALGIDAGTLRPIATSGQPLSQEMIYLVVPDKALQDPGVRPLLEDFIRCVAQAYQWQNNNPEAALPTVARYYKLPPRLARNAMGRSAAHFVPIDEQAIVAQQAEADAFAHLGLVKSLNVRPLFDLRFNDVVQRATLPENATVAPTAAGAPSAQ